VRPILTNEMQHQEYLELLNTALDTERDGPSPIFDYVAPNKRYKSTNLGDLVKYGSSFSHNIYHFDVDPETFRTTHVEFASPYVTAHLGRVLFERLRRNYHETLDDNTKTASEIGFAYENFVIGSFTTLPHNEIIRGTTFGTVDTVKEFGRPGTLHYSQKGTIGELNKVIKAVFDHYKNERMVIKPAERFTALDFVVVDNTLAKTRVSLYQITRNIKKQIVPSHMKELDFLLENKNFDVHFYLVTDRKELTKISWEGAKDHVDIVKKWKDCMEVVRYDGSSEDAPDEQ